MLGGLTHSFPPSFMIKMKQEKNKIIKLPLRFDREDDDGEVAVIIDDTITEDKSILYIDIFKKSVEG